MLRRYSGFALSLLLLSASIASAADSPTPLWVVVVAPEFRDAIKPLLEHRKGQGFQTTQVLTTDVLSAAEIRAGDGGKLRLHVNKLCRNHDGPSYVLLVGAVRAEKPDLAERIVVPPLNGGVGRMKGQPSDNGYGCLNDDHQPSVPVGRFPARTKEEARQMAQKTLAYEGDDKPGEWRHRLTILAGAPAYNPLVDRMVEAMAFARLDRLNPSWTGRAVYSNPQSRFCPPDAELQSVALKYVEDGEAWTLYLGHSNAEGLWGGGAHYLDRDDWSKLKIGRGAGVFATFGCNGCQLIGRRGEGYGVAAMRNPDGPVAVIGSHGICFAAMVQLATDGLVDSTFAGKSPERLGASWLAIKADIAKGEIDALTFHLLDAVDGDNNIPQAMQRLEHLEMFMLLGDPALKMAATPADLVLKTDVSAAPAGTLTITGAAPAWLNGGQVHVVVERPVSSSPTNLLALPKQLGPERGKIIMQNRDRANHFALAEAETTIQEGRFEAKLQLPADMPWTRLNVRAYASTRTTEALGALRIEVPTPP